MGWAPAYVCHPADGTSSRGDNDPVMSSVQEIAYFDAGECLRFVNTPHHREGFSQGVAEGLRGP